MTMKTMNEVSERRTQKKGQGIFLPQRRVGKLWEVRRNFGKKLTFSLRVVSSAASEMSHEKAVQGKFV
jgi:hypothetical protein